MKLAIIFDNFGPYHYARINAVAKNTETIGIEIFGNSFEYQWDYQPDKKLFKHIKLFPVNNRDSVSKKELKIQICKVLDEIKPDAVAINGYYEKSALYALRWCIKNKVKSILMSESTLLDVKRNFLREGIKEKIISYYSSAIVGGKRQVTYLKTLNFNPDLIFEGYDVVDNNHFATSVDRIKLDSVAYRNKYKLPEKYFLVSARFVPKKNIQFIINAYNIYLDKFNAAPHHLVILGDGPLKKEIENLIHKLNLENQIHLPGFIQYAELPVYYALASGFIHASYSEQWGLVINEAMASGLPILASNACGCVDDLIVESQNGYTFNPNNKNELIDKLILLTQDSYKCIKMGEKSREIISEWTPEYFAANLINAASVNPSTPLKNKKKLFILNRLCSL